MIPIHNHTMFSALDGYSTPDEIADRITDLGLAGAFLTDHGTIAGFPKFKKAMDNAGLFAGFGMEAYQAAEKRESRDASKMGEDTAHLVLLAKSEQGYENLLRISDESNRTGFHYRARVDWDLLERFREGIIATSACMASLVNQELRASEGEQSESMSKMHEIFGQDFYIELHTYDSDDQRRLNRWLAAHAKERKIEVVYANDAHYAFEGQYDEHEAFLCAQYNSWVGADKTRKGEAYNPDNPTKYHPQCLFIMDETQVRKALDHLDERTVDRAIANSDLIMEKCRFDLPEVEPHFPVFIKKGISDTKDYLEELVIEGMEQRYGEPKDAPEAWVRADREFTAITGAGLGDYFLIVHDYVNHALERGRMVGPGRGSVGGSILAYALDITTIDPLKYGLQFERFWNPGRSAGLPDIDIDFSKAGREAEIAYVEQKYGDDRVLRVGNHVFLWPKSAIDKAGMVLYEKPPYAIMTNTKKIFETTEDAGKLLDWEETWDELDNDQRNTLKGYWHDYPKLFEFARSFSGRLSTYSTHASAVVISDVPLAGFLPSRMASDPDKTKVLVTQADMYAVEDAGFPKFDFLPLRNLDVLVRAGMLTGEFESEKDVVDFLRFQVDYDNPNHLPEVAWENIDNGLTLGLFQIEEGQGAKRLAKQIAPRNLEDTAVLVALNRPGPLRSGDADRYIKRRKAQEDVSYPHSILMDILEPTYGVFVYQEQVIDYFTAIGYTLSEADHIRKVIGKKLPKEMAAEKPKYDELAQQFMSKATADSIWELIINYSKYGFNKAHAVGYGKILAMTVFAKCWWRTEFVMASIENYPKKVGGFVSEARRMDPPIQVLPPSVNHSGATISKDGEAIRYGLVDIKGIGLGAAQKVIDGAPYESPEDYVRRCEADHGVRKKLQAAGAFDELGYRLGDCPTCQGKGREKVQVPKKSGDGMKSVYQPCTACSTLGLVQVGIPDKKARAESEIELLGIALTDANESVVAKYQDRIDKCDPYEAADTEEEKEIKVAGVITEVKEGVISADKYNAGRKYVHVTIERDGNQLRFAAWPDKFDDFKYMLKPRVYGEFLLKTSARGAKLMRGYQYL